MLKKILKEYLPFAVLIVLILVLKSYVVTTIRVNGNSMNPTLKNNDIMLLNKIGYRFSDIERFDIVVVQNGDSKIIKRVIGLPGEVVEYKDNTFYIDDEVVEDKYNSIEQEDFLVVLGEDEYFVMGDNRGDSLDSRILGPILKDKILGQATFTIFPFSRWGVQSK